MVSRYIICSVLGFLFSCKGQENKIKVDMKEEKLLPIVTNMVNSDSVPKIRIFTFEQNKPFMITLRLDSTGKSSFSMGNKHIEFSELFYSREKSKGIGNSYHLEKYKNDSISFFSDFDNMIFSRWYKINISNKEYVLIEFKKNKMDVMPLEKAYYYLFEVSDLQHLNGIGFMNVGEYGLKDQIFKKGNILVVQCKYWQRREKLGEFMLYHDNNYNWKLGHVVK